MLALLKKNWINFLNLFVFVTTSLYFVLIGALEHYAFRSHAYDFGLHNQQIYQLSRFRLTPANTIHQIPNLFWDHQHFAQLILAPFFWIGNGFNGLTLVVLAPLILIFFPSLIFWLIFRDLNKVFSFWKHTPVWILAFTSLVLAFDPQTQMAVVFFFHERYLINLFLPLSLWFLVRALIKDQETVTLQVKITNNLAKTFSREKIKQTFQLINWNYFWAIFWAIFWLMTKEDQWIFILVFFAQIVFWLFLTQKFILKKVFLKSNFYSFLVILALVISFYNGIFLPTYLQGNQVNNNIESYKTFVNSTKQLPQDRDLESFITSNDLRNGNQVKLYKANLSSQLFGTLVFPLDTVGNSLQRNLSSKAFLKSMSFQYGSDLSLYTLIGIFSLYLLFKYLEKTDKIKILTKFNSKLQKIGLQLSSTLLLLGLSCSTIGLILVEKRGFATPIFHLNTHLQRASQVENERNDFYNIIKNIEPDASVVTSGFYSSHLASRDKIINYPPNEMEAVKTQKNRKMENLDEYTYWLIPKSDGAFKDKLVILKNNSKYTIVAENNSQILFKKNQ